MEAAEVIYRMQKAADGIYSSAAKEGAPVAATFRIDGKLMLADVKVVQRAVSLEVLEEFRKKGVVEIHLGNIRELPAREPPETTKPKRWKRRG